MNRQVAVSGSTEQRRCERARCLWASRLWSTLCTPFTGLVVCGLVFVFRDNSSLPEVVMGSESCRR